MLRRLYHPEWKLKCYLPALCLWTTSPPNIQHNCMKVQSDCRSSHKFRMEFILGARKLYLLLTTVGSAYLEKVGALRCLCASFTAWGRGKFWLCLDIWCTVPWDSTLPVTSHRVAVFIWKSFFPGCQKQIHLSSPCSPPLMLVFSISQVVLQICLDTPFSLL